LLIAVGTGRYLVRVGYVQMSPADEVGFDNELDEQLRAIVKEASLQPRLVENLHGSEDVQTLLSRHLDQRFPSEGRFTILSRQ